MPITVDDIKQISNSQAVFMYARKRAIEIFGADSVYDNQLPNDNVAYPFVYIAQSDSTKRFNKDGRWQDVHLTIRVYHNDSSQRGLVSAILEAMETALTGQVVYKDIAIRLREAQQFMNNEDVPSGLSFVHGRLEIDFSTNR